MNENYHDSITKSTFFIVSKNVLDTEEGNSKSMKNALYVQRNGKMHFLGWSNVNQQENSLK